MLGLGPFERSHGLRLCYLRRADACACWPYIHVTHMCDELAWWVPLLFSTMRVLRTRESCLSPSSAHERGGVTRNNRHRACWPPLTTSETLQSSHLAEIARNPLFRRILPVSLTRSRFCGLSFKTTEWFQDFRGIWGEGGTLPNAPECVHALNAERDGTRLSLYNQPVDRGLPTGCQIPVRVPGFVSRPGFSRAANLPPHQGFSPCGAGQGLKPSCLQSVPARLKPCPDTKLIFHRIPRRRTDNPQRRCTVGLRPDIRTRTLL
jgi:hypothetical protein